MKDPLFARAQIAIEESLAIRKQRQALLDEQDGARSELRRNLLETALLRTEFKARRDDKD